MHEELEALDNELKGQNFGPQSWWDVWSPASIKCQSLYPFICVLSQSWGMQIWLRCRMSEYGDPNPNPGRSGPIVWV